MFTVKYDTKELTTRFTAYEQKVLPFATAAALNDTMFRVRDGFREEFATVFDRPTPFTLNSLLFTKATKNNLAAQVFVRNESRGGTPPSKYLFPEAAGGRRGQRPFEKSLRKAGGSYYTPGRSYPLNQYGNIPAGTIRAILSQLQANTSFLNESQERRGRRLKRQAKRGGGKSYFVLKEKRGKLIPGAVYERIETAHGSAVRTVLFPVRQASYRIRFNAGKVAQRIFDAYFPNAFRRRLAEFQASVVR